MISMVGRKDIVSNLYNNILNQYDIMVKACDLYLVALGSNPILAITICQ